METAQERPISQWMVIGLIGLGVVARWVPHPPNVTPLTALALFGGAYLSRRWAIGLPLVAVVLSDLVIGLHETVAFTWGAFALAGLLGWWVRRQPSAKRIVLGSCAGSMLFFLVTNFGVWLLGHQGTMYPQTLDGLVSCYAAALPFLRNTFAGDLMWTAGLFGLYALASARGRAPRLAQAR